MMILNLISAETKKTLRQYLFLGIARTAALTVGVLGIVFLISFAFGSFELRTRAQHLSVEADRSTLLTQGQLQATAKDATKRINAQILVLKNLQKRYVDWLPVLQAFGKLVPTGVHITSISLTQQPLKVEFSGTADTRDAYVAYEAAIAKSTIVGKIVFPLQTKKTDIDFSLTAPLNITP